jgi:hypothetical protein
MKTPLPADVPEDYLTFVTRMVDAGDVPDFTPDDRAPGGTEPS